MSDVEANKAVARRYMQAVVDGDIDTIEALQHPDCRWWILGHGEMSRADFIGSVKGGLLSAQRRTVEIVGITAEGDRVGIGRTFPVTTPLFSARWHQSCS